MGRNNKYIKYSGIAQLVEQRTVNPLVLGSSPSVRAGSETQKEKIMYDEKLDPSFARNINIEFDEATSSEKCLNFILTTKTNFGTTKRKVVFTSFSVLPKCYRKAMETI